MADPTAGRRTFGPVVLAAGLSGAALAMAGTQPWFRAEGDEITSCPAPCLSLTYDNAGVAPAATALALVVLACLGVVLVTRGRFRLVVTVVGLLAAVGGLVSVVAAYVQGPAEFREVADQLGAVVPDIGTTGWFWIGAVASVISVLAWVAAVRYVRTWPEMGSRYDAPSDDPPEDLWKALDQGHDPTALD